MGILQCFRRTNQDKGGFTGDVYQRICAPWHSHNAHNPADRWVNLHIVPAHKSVYSIY